MLAPRSPLGATARADRAATRGTELRRAWQERAAQDLLYRTEYLATLVSEAADTKVSSGEDLRQTLATSQAPCLVSATAALLCQRPTEGQTALLPPRCSSNTPTMSSKASPWPRLVDVEEARDRGGRTAATVQALAAWEDSCGSVRRMIATLPQPVRIDYAARWLQNLKVAIIQGVPEGALGEDHVSTVEAQLRRHLEKCCCVEHLQEDFDSTDTAATGMRFARHFWQRHAQTPVLRKSRPSRLIRADGGDELCTDKFSLVEGSMTLVRQEGSDPFQSHALATMDAPVQVFPEGHYFEVRVATLFWSPGRPDRPRHRAARSRTEGLLLGLTTMPPSAFRGSVGTAASVPSAWCVSMSGTYYATRDPSAGRPRRPVSQERILKPRPWHRGAPQKCEQLRCLWPMPPSPGAVRKQLQWTVAVDEGDTVGFLVTPFGGVAVTVNGERHLMVPDAAACVDQPLYPLIEAYNHVRSIQLIPEAVPPK